ncbi:hypothetical protein BGZ65_012900, partial [Modicella reniformis]
MEAQTNYQDKHSSNMGGDQVIESLSDPNVLYMNDQGFPMNAAFPEGLNNISAERADMFPFQSPMDMSLSATSPSPSPALCSMGASRDMDPQQQGSLGQQIGYG